MFRTSILTCKIGKHIKVNRIFLFSHYILFCLRRRFFLKRSRFLVLPILFRWAKQKMQEALKNQYGGLARLDTFGVKHLEFTRSNVLIFIYFISFFTPRIVSLFFCPFCFGNKTQDKKIVIVGVVTARLDTFGVMFHSFLPF